MMKLHKKCIIVLFCLTLFSLSFACVLNYIKKELFWSNVMLGVFGSSLLTLVTSIIGYRQERIILMEQFYQEMLRLINKFNRYQTDLPLEQKIDFFLDMSDYDMDNLGNALARMDFFDNKINKYIFDEIYKPALDVYHTAISHSWHFRMHRNGTARNEEVMRTFIEEIEPCFISKEEAIIEDENMEHGSYIIINKFVNDTLDKLNGKYYEIMYGKKRK